MHWGVPSFPLPPRGQPSVRVVRDAYLTPVDQGPLHGFGRPDRWFTGAVHDRDGALVRASVRRCDLGGHRWVAADPRRVAVPRRRRSSRMRGRWLYGGTWCEHFGHFLVESLSTLWPDADRVGAVEGVVFHRGPRRRTDPGSWKGELMALAGHGGRPVTVLGDDGAHVDELVVPSRTVVLNGWAHPPARDAWLRIAAAAGPAPADAPRRVLLSRTEFHAAQRARGEEVRESPERDQEVDAVFAEQGFTVLAPERLPITAQVRLLAGVDLVAGGAGSALHLSVFARSGTGVVELGDARSPDQSLATQRVVDTVCGHRSAFAARDWSGARLREELAQLLEDA